MGWLVSVALLAFYICTKNTDLLYAASIFGIAGAIENFRIKGPENMAIYFNEKKKEVE